MADENNNVAAASGVEAVDGVKAKTTKKQRSPKREKALAETVPTASTTTTAKTQGSQRKTYSERERAEKLTLIGTQVAKGTATLHEAIKSAGISVPAYYRWKRNGAPAAKKVAKAVSGGHELAELVQLEAENQKLRGQLAEKLRAENVELRKRLGLEQSA
ncbi:transcriptional regulator (plasmid) [Aminobacter sp. SR38]|jgi:putative transposase|uniref:transcriptional regulator n=1 Tax=Aminobacter sp. SR38 TaxID=2774562 RepID=UPI00177AE9BD|nr:transcriptional regulator [Aminobacter sp. SR38]QOF75046.1 transcriptional regulator [Aminobacter sp. SR38]